MGSTLQTSTPARLHHMEIVSAEPARLAQFYQQYLGLEKLYDDASQMVLVGPERAIEIRTGSESSCGYCAYAVGDVQSLESLRKRLIGDGVQCVPVISRLYEPGAFTVSDPQGRRIAFGVSALGDRSRQGAPARMQHTVFQTTELESVVRFYVERIGFAVSDEVVDENGRLMVVFMRSDDEHHTLAFFRGSQNEWDHHCYETKEWNDIRDWGDQFARGDIPIFFGPGRHGPGNNLFFMITDPDGNRLEFSAELERVDADATPGVWPNTERTLNSWGRAWMRT